MARSRYPGAAREWMNLAEQKAQKQGLEFIRDTEKQRGFRIPGDRLISVRGSKDQWPSIQLTDISTEMEIIKKDHEEIGRVLIVVLLIHDEYRFDPDVDDFVPIRDSLLTRRKYTKEYEEGKIQLSINMNETPFRDRKNKWNWVFEK